MVGQATVDIEIGRVEGSDGGGFRASPKQHSREMVGFGEDEEIGVQNELIESVGQTSVFGGVSHQVAVLAQPAVGRRALAAAAVL